MLRLTPRSTRAGRPAGRVSRLVPWALVAAVGFLAFPAPAARGQNANVLDQVPSEALAVLKIKSLQGLSDKIADLAKQFKVTDRVAQLGDPLGTLEQQLGLKAGLNKAGSLAVVVLAGEGGPPRGLALVPVSDFKAFVGNFQDPQPEGDLTSFKAPNGVRRLYAAQWGEWAAISPIKEVLANKPGGLKVTGATAKELDTKDVVLLANLKVIAPQVLPMLKMAKPQLLDQVGQAMARNPNADPKSIPVLKAVIGQYLAVFEEFLSDARAATFSLNLSHEGIATSLMAEFEADTYIGKLVGAAPPEQADRKNLMAGLPEGKYMVFGGAALDGKAMAKLLDDIAKPVVAEAKNQGLDIKAAEDYLAAMKDVMEAQQSQAFGLLAPSGQLGRTSLIQAVSVSTADAARALAAQKKAIESEQAFMQMLPQMPGMTVQTTYAEGAKTVEGVKFNQFQMKFDMKANTPVEGQIKGLLALVYGPEGLTGYIGAADEKHVVGGVGVGDEVLAAAIASAKSGKDVIGTRANVEAVTRNLPANPCMVAYISLDVIAATAGDYLKQAGVAFPIDVPQDLPPIGVAVASEGTALRLDSYIPSQLVQSLIAAGEKAWIRAMGGPGQ